MERRAPADGTIERNALALEYQREYGCARRNVDIADVVDKPLVKGEGRVFGPGFLEQVDSLCFGQVRPFLKESADPLFVSEKRI